MFPKIREKPGRAPGPALVVRSFNEKLKTGGGILFRRKGLEDHKFRRTQSRVDGKEAEGQGGIFYKVAEGPPIYRVAGEGVIDGQGLFRPPGNENKVGPAGRDRDPGGHGTAASVDKPAGKALPPVFRDEDFTFSGGSRGGDDDPPRPVQGDAEDRRFRPGVAVGPRHGTVYPPVPAPGGQGDADLPSSGNGGGFLPGDNGEVPVGGGDGEFTRNSGKSRRNIPVEVFLGLGMGRREKEDGEKKQETRKSGQALPFAAHKNDCILRWSSRTRVEPRFRGFRRSWSTIAMEIRVFPRCSSLTAR